MPKASPVHVGEQFGLWEVISEPWQHRFPSGGTKQKARCRCTGCDGEWDVFVDNMRQGKSGGCKSCTSPGPVTHGESGTMLHRRWKAMKNRCACDPHYTNVEVCDLWQTYEGFRDNPPLGGGELSRGTVLARYGDSGDYSPGNTRWLTIADNARERNGKPLVDNPELAAL